MKSVLFSIIVLLSLNLSAAENVCSTNRGLVELGWVQHDESEFAEIYAKLTERVSQNSNIEFDLETVFPSRALRKPVHMISYDDLTTDRMVMYGDILIYSDAETAEVIELRWYEDSKKHFVTSSIPCSSDTIPQAENALF